MGRGKFEDLTGTIFGRLTVIKRVENDKHNKAQWLCRCECGNEVVVRANSLKSGKQLSCGCLQRERIVEAKKQEKWSEERKQKQSEIAKQLWKDEEFREKQSGKNSHFYNHNLTDEERSKNRYSKKHIEWSNKVKQQANYTCDICGQHGGKLESHHLNDYNHHEDSRLDVSNGVCLCESCHKEFHWCYMGDTKTICSEDDYLDFKEVKQNYDIR